MRDRIARAIAAGGDGIGRSNPSMRKRTCRVLRKGSTWMSVARASTARSNNSLTARTTGAPLAMSRSQMSGRLVAYFDTERPGSGNAFRRRSQALSILAGREPVTIHPQDAQARGIVDGDLVRVWNARGQVLAGAVVTEGIRPGVICLHEGAWPDLDPQVGICKNGAVNVLTKDIPTSRLGNGCAGNTALAWLEKYTGPALPLTAFDPPANA